MWRGGDTTQPLPALLHPHTQLLHARATAPHIVHTRARHQAPSTVPARPVERARAHERKKALKKALTEDVGADALRGPPCSAHLSG